MNSNRFHHIALALTFVVGTLLRLYLYFNWSFSNDELSALSRLDFSSFSEIINFGVIPDGHPAGIQIFLYLWTSIFGISELAVRFPFLIFSMLSIYIAYLVGKTWSNKTVGLLLSISLAVFTFPLSYAIIARPYSLGLLSILSFTYYWLKIQKSKSYFNLLGFITFGTIALYTHYFSFMVVGILGIIGMTSAKNNRKQYIVGCILMLILFTPHVNIFFQQLKTGGLAWLAKPDVNFLLNHCYLLFNSNPIVLMVIATSSLIFRNKKIHFKSLIVYLSPIIIGFLYSIVISPVIQDSVLLFSLPFGLLFIYSMLQEEKVKTYLPISIFVLGLSSSIYSDDILTKNQFGVFKELAHKNLEWNSKYGEHNITHITHLNNQWYFDFYYKQEDKTISTPITKIEHKDDVIALKQFIDTIETEYVTFSWSSVATNPVIYDIIMDKYPTIIDQETQFNCQASLFKKGGKRNSLYQYICDAESSAINLWDLKSIQQDTSYSFSGKSSERLDSTNLYSSGIELSLSSIDTNLDSIYINNSVMAFAKTTAQATLVIEFKTKDDEIIEWYGVDIDNYIINTNKWQKAFCSRAIPKACSKNDKIKIYLWNRGSNSIYLDDFQVNIYSREKIYF